MEAVASIIVREPHIRFDGKIPMNVLLQIMAAILPDGDWSTYTFYYDLRINLTATGANVVRLTDYHEVSINYSKMTGEWSETGPELKLDSRPWYSTPGNKMHILVRIFET